MRCNSRISRYIFPCWERDAPPPQTQRTLLCSSVLANKRAEKVKEQRHVTLSDSLIYVHNAKTTYICKSLLHQSTWWDIILVPRTFICTVPFDRPPLPVLLFSFFLNGDLLFTVLTFVDEQETKSLHVKHKSCFNCH